MDEAISWRWKQFDEISSPQLYEVLAVRQQVFVVEQQCPYQDADGLDKDAWHLLGYGAQGVLIAYARLTFPGKQFEEPSFGRVLTSQHVRKLGIGRQIVQHCIQKCHIEYPSLDIRISAQTHLREFYVSFGFQPVGAPYDEDGIEHIEMVLQQL